MVIRGLSVSEWNEDLYRFSVSVTKIPSSQLLEQISFYQCERVRYDFLIDGSKLV